MRPSEPERKILSDFCETQQLPAHFMDLGTRYFLPLAKELAERSTNNTGSSLLVGINGCQGSGKSTLADLLERVLSNIYGKTVANLSIDDFYHTKTQRQQLATQYHPLFNTRGVPGTHDVPLLQQTLATLQTNQRDIPIVRFNKAIDDRHPEANWDHIDGPVDIILLEGWCVGVFRQQEKALLEPVNTLEQEEDANGQWRHRINDYILKDYEPLFSTLHLLVMLKAPDFRCVYDWRQTQEDKLRQANIANKNTHIMTPAELKRFIEHYQRLTEHMLCSLPERADIVFELNAQHQITKRLDNGK